MLARRFKAAAKVELPPKLLGEGAGPHPPYCGLADRRCRKEREFSARPGDALKRLCKAGTCAGKKRRVRGDLHRQAPHVTGAFRGEHIFQPIEVVCPAAENEMVGAIDDGDGKLMFGGNRFDRTFRKADDGQHALRCAAGRNYRIHAAGARGDKIEGRFDAEAACTRAGRDFADAITDADVRRYIGECCMRRKRVAGDEKLRDEIIAEIEHSLLLQRFHVEAEPSRQCVENGLRGRLCGEPRKHRRVLRALTRTEIEQAHRARTSASKRVRNSVRISRSAEPPGLKRRAVKR